MKIDYREMLMDEKNVAILRWIFVMQKIGMSITLQQMKLKVAKLIETKPIPFWNGIFGIVGEFGSNTTTLNLMFIR